MAITRRSTLRTTLHYCSCYPKSLPDSERVPAKYYCFRHRRHLCDNCIYDELNQRHISCFVGTYDSFIQSGPTAFSEYKKNKCPICSETLPDDDARAVVRLNCTCVYHAKCLQHYLLENTTNDVPCVQCNLPIASTPSTRGSNLAKSVDNFLRSVSRQRLWNKPKRPATANLDRQSLRAQPSNAHEPERKQQNVIEDAPPNEGPNVGPNEVQNVIENVAAPPIPSRLHTSPYPKRKPVPRTKPRVPTKSPRRPSAQRPAASNSKPPVRSGHIMLDTRELTRHRTGHGVKTGHSGHSMNPDGNKGDDKYHKKRRGFVPNYVGRPNAKNWVPTKRTLILLLLCCAVVAQCCFIYILFVRDNEGETHLEREEAYKKLFSEDSQGMDDVLGNQAKVRDLRDRVMQ